MIGHELVSNTVLCQCCLPLRFLGVVGHADQAGMMSTNRVGAYENTDVISFATLLYMLKGSDTLQVQCRVHARRLCEKLLFTSAS